MDPTGYLTVLAANDRGHGIHSPAAPRQDQHRPVGEYEASEGGDPETGRNDQKRHGPGRTERGRDTRDRREGHKTIDQNGDTIGRKIAPDMATRGSCHHRQNHRADRPRRQRVDGRTERHVGVQHGQAEQRDTKHEPGIADMENKQQRFRGRCYPAPAEQAPEIDRRTEQKQQADRPERRQECPANEARMQELAPRGLISR